MTLTFFQPVLAYYGRLPSARRIQLVCLWWCRVRLLLQLAANFGKTLHSAVPAEHAMGEERRSGKGRSEGSMSDTVPATAASPVQEERRGGQWNTTYRLL